MLVQPSTMDATKAVLEVSVPAMSRLWLSNWFSVHSIQVCGYTKSLNNWANTIQYSRVYLDLIYLNYPDISVKISFRNTSTCTCNYFLLFIHLGYLDLSVLWHQPFVPGVWIKTRLCCMKSDILIIYLSPDSKWNKLSFFWRTNSLIK